MAAGVADHLPARVKTATPPMGLNLKIGLGSACEKLLLRHTLPEIGRLQCQANSAVAGGSYGVAASRHETDR